MLYGRTSASLPSRFLKEIPEECLIRKGGYRRASVEYGSGEFPQSRPTSAHRQPPRFTGNSVGASAAVPMLELNSGDMIQHAAFGRGMVLSVMKMGGDALLEIAFDDIGTKKLMAKTASAHMKKL